ncbi:MAG: FprA family A-type flavoprotein [Actinobacteria bacterium]|nr:FprA family A-type flavoprotein [Actinomycetota bacterium]
MDNILTNDIYWVGIHFPEPAPGASLNSFIIKDEKCALIDAGPPATVQMMLENIRNLLDPAKIDYIILTHADLDHAGGLKEILKAAPQAIVITSDYESKMLPMWGVQANIQVVKDGDTISLGRHTLRFIAAPFICTPGSMLIFDETDGVLFSSDLFALMGPQKWQLFAEGDQTEALKMVQAFKLGRTEYVRQALAKVKELPVNIVASGHGQALKGDIASIAQALID